MTLPDRVHVTSAPDLQILQPARPYERALIGFIDRQLNIPAEQIRTVWNADTCPATHLPWLAWTFGVDEWDPDWDEATKRAVIKASPDVHRHKGTRYALDKAMNALGLNLTVSEWFQYGGSAYRFKIDIDLTDSDRTWSLKDARYVLNTAIRAKNVRSFLEDIRIHRNLRNPGEIGVGLFTNNVTTVTIAPMTLDHLNLPRPHIWTAVAASSVTTITINPRT
jgi:phage tail P2-like protein